MFMEPSIRVLLLANLHNELPVIAINQIVDTTGSNEMIFSESQRYAAFRCLYRLILCTARLILTLHPR